MNETISNPFLTPPLRNGVSMPKTRTFNGKEYYGTEDVAKILGVDRRTVLNWNSTLYFNCPLFTADERAHDGRYLYEVERVLQLKSVYHPKWMRGSYEPAPIIQNFSTLPHELLTQPRFFPVGADKTPHIKNWSNPDNQKLFSDIQGLAGFDTCGHNKAPDYLFLDWDNVLDDNGLFLNPDAEKCFNFLSTFATYCEKSIRKHGLHQLFKPSQNKFPTFSAGKNSTIHFGDSAKLEIFYAAKARYCLLTGDVFKCKPNSPIIDGDRADKAFLYLIDILNKHHSKKTINNSSSTLDSPEYDNFRANIMLDTINPASLDDSDWLAVISAAKNIGINYNVIDQWNKRDSARYNEKENRVRWDSLSNSSYNIETLHGIAKRFGYSEKVSCRDFFRLHSISTHEIYSHDEATEKSSTLKDFLDQWRTVNHDSPLDPKVVSELKDAKVYIDSLSVENFNPADIDNLSIRRKVALCTFYIPNLAAKFLALLKDANADAKHKIKDEKNPSDKLRALARLQPSKFEAFISELVTSIKRDQKDFELKSLNEQIQIKRKADLAAYEDNPPSTQKIFPDCPIDLILPEGIFIDEKGKMSRVDWDKPAGQKGRPVIDISANPIFPTNIFREPTNHFTQYEVAIRNTSNIWRRVIVDGRTLIDPRKVLELADFGALIKQPAHLAKYFSEIIALPANRGRIPEIKAYKQPGWHNDKFIYPTGGSDYVVRRPGFDYQEIFASRGDPHLWLQTFLSTCRDGGAIVRIFMGFALSSILVRPFNILNPQIHLSAPNDSGKTGLLKLAASIFGNPSEMLKTFAATPKNAIAVAAASNDLPSFADELETLRKANENTLSQMVYEFAQGIANQANKRDGSPRPTVRFKGSKLSAAERPLLKTHDQRGAYKRLLQLDIRNKFFNDIFAAKLHFITENNFGLFGKTWVSFVESHLQEMKNKFFEFFSLYSDLPDKRPVEPTLLKAVALAALSLQFFFVSADVQSQFFADDFCNDIHDVTELLPAPSDLDDSTRALSDLQSFIAAHERFFIHESDRPDFDNEITQSAFECFGKIFDNGEVAFFPTALRKILETELGFASMDALVAEWANKDILRKGQGKNFRFSTWLNGKSTPTYRFKAHVLGNNETTTQETAENF